jgi:hypothetical protein
MTQTTKQYDKCITPFANHSSHLKKIMLSQKTECSHSGKKHEIEIPKIMKKTGH